MLGHPDQMVDIGMVTPIALLVMDGIGVGDHFEQFWIFVIKPAHIEFRIAFEKRIGSFGGVFQKVLIRYRDRRVGPNIETRIR